MPLIMFVSSSFNTYVNLPKKSVGALGQVSIMSTAAFLGGIQVLGIILNALSKENIIGKTVGEELKVLTMSE